MAVNKNERSCYFARKKPAVNSPPAAAEKKAGPGPA